MSSHPVLTPTVLPSPQLITFDPFPTAVTLLDLESDADLFPVLRVGQPSQTELDPHAHAFLPTASTLDRANSSRQAPVPLTPESSILIHPEGFQTQADEASVFFRIDTTSSPTPSGHRRFRQSQREARESPRLPRTRLGREAPSFAIRSRSISPLQLTSPRRSSRPRPATPANQLQPTSPTQGPLVDFGQSFPSPPSPRSYIALSYTSSTPELTPDSSLSSTDRQVFTSGNSTDTTTIFYSDPTEVGKLFSFDIRAFPYPTDTLLSPKKTKGVPKKPETVGFDSDTDPEHENLNTARPIKLDLKSGALFDQGDTDIGVAALPGDQLDFGLNSQADFDPGLLSKWNDYSASEDCLVDIFPDEEVDEILGLSIDTTSDAVSWFKSLDKSKVQRSTPSTSSSIHSPTPLRLGEEGYDTMSLLHSNGSSSGRTLSPASQTPIPDGDHIPAVHKISPYSLLLSKPSPRRTVPPHLVYPAVTDRLQTGIMKSWISTEPSEESKIYKKKFLKQLTAIINARFGHGQMSDGKPRFQVDVFGSVSWGGETGKSGDLDLVILDRALPQGYRPTLWRQPPGSEPTPSNGSRRVPTPIESLPRLYHTYALADCLRGARMTAVLPIPGASAPIVKFVKEDKETLQCDINANDLGGWYNSSLILHYCLLSPYLLRPLIHVLKLWASAHDLNDASGSKGPATMSSYCLTLMAIAYLQHRGCLPNLQADITVPVTSKASDVTDPDVIWVSWSRDQGVPAHVAFARQPPPGWTSAEPDLTVADALRGFFAYFSQSTSSVASNGGATSVEEDRFNFKTQIVSILQGGVRTRVKRVGGDKEDEDRLREELKTQGYSMDQIITILENYRKKRLGEEEKMGKGDRGIQPRNWSERRLVVQDPFLWSKNCAGMMSRQGLDAWLSAANTAHALFEKKGKEATVEELLHNPNPPRRGTPGPRGGGRGRGRGASPAFGGRGTPLGLGGMGGRGFQIG